MLRITNLLFVSLLAIGIQLTISAQTNLNNGLVVYLPFNGNATDASTYNNNAVVHGAVPSIDAGGNLNSAFQFDGINDYLAIPPSPSTNLNSYTICVQLQPSDFYNGLCYSNQIVSKGPDASLGYFGLYFTNNQFYGDNCDHPYSPYNSIYATYYHNDYIAKYNTGILPAQPMIQLSQWDCVLLSYDSTTRNMKLFVNGVLHFDTVMSYHMPYNTTDSIFIGRHQNHQFPYWYGGRLDEIRIYNRALNDAEIMAYCEGMKGISNKEIEGMNVKVYPNPGEKFLKLDLRQGSYSREIQVSLTNLFGQSVWTSTYTNVADLNISIPIEHLTPSFYYLKISNGQENQTIKVFKE